MDNKSFDSSAIENFKREIQNIKAAYQRDTISFLATRSDNRFVLVQGAISMNVMPSSEPSKTLKTENIWAARYPISDLGMDTLRVVERLLEGKLDTPDGSLHFLPEHDHRYGVYHTPFSPAALQNRSRVNTLSLTGASRATYVRQPDLDWELRSADQPYDSIQELLFEFGLDTARSGATGVDVVAYSVAAIDKESFVRGEKAKIGIRLAYGLRKESSSIGCRILVGGKLLNRLSIEGSQLSWIDTGNHFLGTVELDVPRSAVIQ